MNPTLIPIRQDRPGFEEFIGSWFYQGNRATVVDVGPSRSIHILLQSLYDVGVKRVDLVLLTHIHADHAGGLAEFLKVFPMAQVICHGRAIGHLIAPANLWLGTQKALGDLALTYGPIDPVGKEWLVSHTEAKVAGLEIFETPGHAPHHLSYVYEGKLFAGEAGGIYLTVGKGEYLRPATPPVFFLKEFAESMDRLLIRGDLPIYFGHFGRAENSMPLLKRARRQLLFWERIISEESSRGLGDAVERCMDRLLKEDPELKAFSKMSLDDQGRERFFIANSIRGYLGYLQNLSGQSLK